MAKKTINKEYFINEYSNYILEEGKKPNNVFQFCKNLKVEEGKFYDYFSSFETLEENIFIAFFENTLALLSKSDDYTNYDTKTKLLSFYFTFFEILTSNRSLVLHLLTADKNKLENLKKLSSLRKNFKRFIDDLNINSPKIPQEKIDELKEKSITEIAWLQLLMTLKFWIEDTSPSFEKTDIFIEKSMHASFDLLDLTPLKNIFDFGKFLWKEKINTSI
jgi:hypothetical protein